MQTIMLKIAIAKRFTLIKAQRILLSLKNLNNFLCFSHA